MIRRDALTSRLISRPWRNSCSVEVDVVVFLFSLLRLVHYWSLAVSLEPMTTPERSFIHQLLVTASSRVQKIFSGSQRTPSATHIAPTVFRKSPRFSSKIFVFLDEFSRSIAPFLRTSMVVFHCWIDVHDGGDAERSNCLFCCIDDKKTRYRSALQIVLIFSEIFFSDPPCRSSSR